MIHISRTVGTHNFRHSPRPYFPPFKVLSKNSDILPYNQQEDSALSFHCLQEGLAGRPSARPARPVREKLRQQRQLAVIWLYQQGPHLHNTVETGK